MLLFTDLPTYPHTYSLAVALYLDGYAANDADALYIVLPKRRYASVTDPKRQPHMPPNWSRRQFSYYRAQPLKIVVDQFWVLDDDWARQTLDLVAAKFSNSLDEATKVAFYMWQNILFWQRAESRRSYNVGFAASIQSIALILGLSSNFVNKVIAAMLDADLIHRKWTGNNLMHRGSCYLPGSAKHLENLLENRN